MPSLVTIKTLQDRNKLIDEVLESRKRLKEHREGVKQEEAEYKQKTGKFASALIEPLKPLLEPIAGRVKELADSNRQLLPAPISQLPAAPNVPKVLNVPNIPKVQALEAPPTATTISKTLAAYLGSQFDRSNTQYSMIHNDKNKKFRIGNSVVGFQEDKIFVAGKPYDATAGLLELLTKKSPNENLYNNPHDLNAYKQILFDTNAIYREFDPAKGRINGDKSYKWSLAKRLIDSISSSTGRGIELLPQDPNVLIDMLYLSFSSLNAGNTSATEYNKIFVILDELLRQKVINKTDYWKISRSITFS
jgi:hypothetical protein